MFWDLGMGILMTLLTSKLFGMPVTLDFLIGGIVFSFMMDFDALVNLIRHRGISDSHNHRDLFHLPLIYIPIGMIILFFFSPAWSVLFGLASLMHFIHDSIGIGWGVQWLYPFSTDHYSFFYQYNTYGKIPKKLVYVWKHKDIDELEQKYGDKKWFQKIYFRLHPYNLAEFAIFVIAVLAWWMSVK